MGRRGVRRAPGRIGAALALGALALGAGGAGCHGGRVAGPEGAGGLPARVVADFERATLAGPAAYAALFDFTRVGTVEVLLRRADLDGRVALDAARRDEFARDDGTPLPEARERRNVTAFHPLLAARTVGTGGCAAGAPASRYGRLLGTYVEPLRADLPHRDAYERARVLVNGWLARGGAVGVRCRGGEGGLVLVYTAAPGPRGYALITIYDDVDDLADLADGDGPAPAAAPP